MCMSGWVLLNDEWLRENVTTRFSAGQERLVLQEKCERAAVMMNYRRGRKLSGYFVSRIGLKILALKYTHEFR